MRRLDRYIFAEVLGPLALGFLVYTFILLIQVLFKSADLLIGSGVEAATIGRLLLLYMPSIVVMTIPMSLLFGILIGVGRLSTDSELVAIRASGVSLFSLYRPILLLSALLTGLNVYLMLEVLPQGNSALAKLQHEIFTQSFNEEIKPRIPHTSWQDKLLYVFDAPPGEGWDGVFLADSIPGQENSVWIAKKGRADADEDTGQVYLELEDVVTHGVDFTRPEIYQASRQDSYSVVLAGTNPRQRSVSVSRSLRELSLRELRQKAKDPGLPEAHRNLALVEIHKMFSFPAACLVFGLLGLPLGFSNARGGRSSGFAVSMGVVLVYYLIFNSGEEAAKDGSVPVWLAVWAPNVLMLGVGLFLVARKNRDKSLMLQNVDRWIQEHFWGRWLAFKEVREAKAEERKSKRQGQAGNRRRRRGAPASLVLRLPEFRMRFPNTVDRYILGRFVNVLVMAMFAGLTVYLVADLTENVEDILQNDVSSSVVFDYYKFKIFSILYEIAPIIVLVTTLTTFGLLSRTNEVTACKAAGISLYRLSVPVLVASAALAFLAGMLQSEVLPAANGRVAELQAVIKGQTDGVVRVGRRADQQWLYGKGNQLFNYRRYDDTRRELHNLQIFKFDDDYNLVGRLMVEKATHIEEGWWTFNRGWARTFEGREITGFSTFDTPMKYRLVEAPEYFAGGVTPPEEMNFADLRSYVDELKTAGQKVPDLEVELHNKIAYPVISLVMALVALPFAFRLGRHGALYGIGLSLVLGIIFLVVLSIFTALGKNAILPPVVAIWSPAAIFSIFSLYLFLGIRS